MDIDPKFQRKLIFIYNCLDDGWCVKKKDQKFIFFKKHNKSNKYYKKKYINEFVETNLELKSEFGTTGTKTTY